ncbi:MAG: DEAD/DEAH box helicase [Bacteroidota bacterium]|nr:DEAD/DEAH box helicase [Bacteroidota bacterium]
MKFSEFNLHSEVFDGLQSMGFEKTTPVQEQAIPYILEGRDIIACAQTGTGKTAAYLLPVLNSILTCKDDGVKAIIIAPTRELAQQIDQHLQGFAYFLSVSSIAIYGGGDGVSWDQQKRALISGADIVIATPGRLISHLNFDYVNLEKLKYLILDEADRMLDMGFHDDIMTIIKALPATRQTLLFSATMPTKIRHLTKNILNNPAQVSIAIAKPAEGITQAAYLVHDTQKVNLIKDLLHKKDVKSIIIFSATKLNVKQLHRDLLREKYRAASIHSDLEQEEREKVMLDFKNQKVQILVATNIVSRGIDIDGIDLIINYDVPRDAEDYIHRIGRTARAESSGLALTFINEKEQGAFRKIEEMLEKEVYKIQLPKHLGEGPEYNPTKYQRGRGDQRWGRKKKTAHGKTNTSNKKSSEEKDNKKHTHPSGKSPHPKKQNQQSGNHPKKKRPWHKKNKNKNTNRNDRNTKSD